MERKRKFLSRITAFEEFRQMISDGLRPGQMTLDESVRYFDELKKRTSKTDKYESAEGELSGFICDEEILSAVTEAFRMHVVPMSEENVREAVDAVKMLSEIEEISDGLCEFILRGGIRPTIENVYRLRYEREQAMPVTREFEEEELRLIDEVLESADLAEDVFARSVAEWILSKNILLSTGNVELLYGLWTTDLPMDYYEAAALAAESLRQGLPAACGEVIKKEGAEAGRVGFAEREEEEREEAERESLRGSEAEAYRSFEGNDGGDSVLERLEDRYREMYLKNHTEEEYYRMLYERFVDVVSTHVTEAEILLSQDIPVTPDNLEAMREIAGCTDGEKSFWTEFYEVAGADAYDENSIARIMNPERDLSKEKKTDDRSYAFEGEISPLGTAGKCLRLLDERTEEYLKEGRGILEITEVLPSGNGGLETGECPEKEYLFTLIRLRKIFRLLREFENRGCREFTKDNLRIRLREEKNGEITVLTNFPDGGVMVKICKAFEKETAWRYLPEGDSDGRILIIGQNEESLKAFKESGIMMYFEIKNSKSVSEFISENVSFFENPAYFYLRFDK